MTGVPPRSVTDSTRKQTGFPTLVMMAMSLTRFALGEYSLVALDCAGELSDLDRQREVARTAHCDALEDSSFPHSLFQSVER